VAIVGKSGCGKSTLVRLLLGFEKPSRGVICYDKKDLQQLDVRSVRRQIGTVMQDGRLFSGSIFENIVISAPR
jgi:ABC-type bacteriocin/lantibiotic exporter with double-glycine peptidase domain